MAFVNLDFLEPAPPYAAGCTITIHLTGLVPANWEVVPDSPGLVGTVDGKKITLGVWSTPGDFTVNFGDVKSGQLSVPITIGPAAKAAAPPPC